VLRGTSGQEFVARRRKQWSAAWLCGNSSIQINVSLIRAKNSRGTEPMKEDVTGGWRDNYIMRSFRTSTLRQILFRVIKSWSMRGVGNVARQR
jgi:hypothetical protein